MVNVTVEVIKPFVHSYPVVSRTGDDYDFTEDRLVPGPDGFLVKRPVTFKKIEGFVEFTRTDGAGKVEVVTEGTGLLTLPKEVADVLIARGCVAVVDDGRTYRAEEDEPQVQAPPRAEPRAARNRPQRPA